MGFTKLSSKLSLTILILIKYTKLVGFTRLISYFSFYYSYLALICILLSPSPKPQWFPSDSRNDSEPKGTTQLVNPPPSFSLCRFLSPSVSTIFVSLSVNFHFPLCRFLFLLTTPSFGLHHCSFLLPRWSPLTDRCFFLANCRSLATRRSLLPIARWLFFDSSLTTWLNLKECWEKLLFPSNQRYVLSIYL